MLAIVSQLEAESAHRVLLVKQRDAKLAEVRAIEEYLGMEPKVQAVCPDCLRKRNVKAIGGPVVEKRVDTTG